MERDPVHVVVMGVSATGKTTIGEAMSAELDFDFIEGDSLHPPANIKKMEAGVPLDDADREPWLRAIAERLASYDARGLSTVTTCSALRRRYRDLLSSSGAHEPFFVHLAASFEVLEQRMALRTKHFMPTSLLRSQFDTLEPLEPDENGVVVDVTPPVDEVVAAAVKAVRERYPG
jgi:gluconokinase